MALLTDGTCTESKPSQRSPCREGNAQQREEILRVVLDDVNAFAEMGPNDGGMVPSTELAGATRGSSLVAIEIQDFSNFLRVPLVSHALVKWEVATSNGGGKSAKIDKHGRALLLSRSRPIVSSAIEVANAVVNLSATSTQCLNQCLGEFVVGHGLEGGTGDGESHGLLGNVSPEIQRRRKGYVVSNRTDCTLLFGQVSTTEAIALNPGVSKSCRWRRIPAPTVKAEGKEAHGGSPNLVFMIRLALPPDSNTLATSAVGSGAAGGRIESWTEPFAADCEGTYMVRSSISGSCVRLPYRLLVARAR